MSDLVGREHPHLHTCRTICADGIMQVSFDDEYTQHLRSPSSLHQCLPALLHMCLGACMRIYVCSHACALVVCTLAVCVLFCVYFVDMSFCRGLLTKGEHPKKFFFSFFLKVQSQIVRERCLPYLVSIALIIAIVISVKLLSRVHSSYHCHYH